MSRSTLRWLPDLDRLIDGATRQVLPEDAKARSVLRLMLAQALRLGLPPHAVIATGLPLLPGARRVFGGAARRGTARRADFAGSRAGALERSVA